MSDYRFKEPPPREAFELLPPGDYIYVVTECDPDGPHKSKSGSGLTLDIKVAIQPSGRILKAWPWTGTDSNGSDRDGIAEFLLSCNRASKVDEEPAWSKVVGAKGKCRLKIDKDQNGIERNYVHYFYRPKQANLPQEGKQTTFSQSEFQKARQQQRTSAGEPEPSEIPY